MSINRQFVSEATDFLRDLEQKPEFNRSTAKEAEVKKYAQLNTLRDQVQTEKPADKLWKGF